MSSIGVHKQALYLHMQRQRRISPGTDGTTRNSSITPKRQHIRIQTHGKRHANRSCTVAAAANRKSSGRLYNAMTADGSRYYNLTLRTGCDDMTKVQKTFRLNPEAIEALESWAKANGQTVTAALEAAIFSLHSDVRADVQGSGKNAADGGSEALRASREEVMRLTAQVESLTRMLEHEQELASSLSATLQATQTVAALERGAVAQADGTIQLLERKPSLWQRIKAKF